MGLGESALFHTIFLHRALITVTVTGVCAIVCHNTGLQIGHQSLSYGTDCGARCLENHFHIHGIPTMHGVKRSFICFCPCSSLVIGEGYLLSQAGSLCFTKQPGSSCTKMPRFKLHFIVLFHRLVQEVKSSLFHIDKIQKIEIWWKRPNIHLILSRLFTYDFL